MMKNLYEFVLVIMFIAGVIVTILDKTFEPQPLEMSLMAGLMYVLNRVKS